MKKYFVREFKNSLPAIGFITLALTVIYVMLIVTSYSLGDCIEMLSGITYMGAAVATILPVWIFRYKMKKRSVDLYYSLPLSQTKIFLVKFIIGFLTVLISYTVAYWIGTLAVYFKSLSPADSSSYWGVREAGIKFIYYFPNYFATLIPLYFIYSVSSFAFTRANKTIDGIAFIIFWALAAMVVAEVLNQLTHEYVAEGIEDGSATIYNIYYVYSNYFTLYSPLTFVTDHFKNILFKFNTVDYELYPEMFTVNYTTTHIANIAVGFSLTALISVFGTVWMILSEHKFFKAENVEQISESYFGYKVMIPLYTVTLLGLIDLTPSAILPVAVYILGVYAVTALYKRTLKIGKRQAIIFAVCVAAGILLSLMTKF